MMLFIIKPNIEFRLPVMMLLSFMLFNGLWAQEAITPSGKTISSTTGSVSYTIGQSFYHSLSGTNGFVNEGVQQPFEILVITDIGSDQSTGIELTVYPNPTSDLLTLEVPDYKISGWRFQLSDGYGSMIEKGEIQTGETKFDLSSRPKGIYLLSVFHDDQNQKTYKIIKH